MQTSPQSPSPQSPSSESPPAQGPAASRGASRPVRDTFAALKAEVAFAYENVRFFRAHMEEAGLTPADLREPADVRRIPPTRKMHYRKNFPAGVLAKGRTLNDRFAYRSHSSGTGGERLVTVTPTFVLSERMSRTISVHPPFDAFLVSVPKRRTARYAAPNCSDVECANPRSSIADRTLPDGTLVLPVHYDLLATTPSMVDQAIREIQDYKPHWLYIDPTHLAFLIRNMRQRGLGPPPVGAIALTYTHCTGVARRQVDEFFPRSIPRGDVISMSEFGWVVMECPLGTHHVNTSSFYVELIHEGRPARPGEVAELYLTSLGDKLSPHIRYQTGDFYRPLEQPCPCGHPFLAVKHEGRWRDMLKRKGQVLLTPDGVDDLVGRAPWMDLYKMHQVDEDYFSFRYVPNERFEAQHERTLREALHAALGPDVRLDMERTPYIAGDRSGKFLSCTSAVSADT